MTIALEDVIKVGRHHSTTPSNAQSLFKLELVGKTTQNFLWHLNWIMKLQFSQRLSHPVAGRKLAPKQAPLTTWQRARFWLLLHACAVADIWARNIDTNKSGVLRSATLINQFFFLNFYTFWGSILAMSCPIFLSIPSSDNSHTSKDKVEIIIIFLHDFFG